MHKTVHVPAPIRAVPRDQTYDFGFGDRSRGYAFSVSNGRLVENMRRRNIFFKKYNIVKV